MDTLKAALEERSMIYNLQIHLKKDLKLAKNKIRSLEYIHIYGENSFDKLSNSKSVYLTHFPCYNEVV